MKKCIRVLGTITETFLILITRLTLLIPYQKEAAKAAGSSSDAPKDVEVVKDAEVELPLRGKTAEEQAPPPSAAP